MRAILFVLLLIASTAAFTQPMQLSGRIALANGLPLPGVNVYLKEANTGTISKSDGQFMLSVIEPGTYTLVVSSIGFVTQEHQVSVPLAKETDLRFVLDEAITQLPAIDIASVSLTGGLNRRKDLTGSSFYLSPKELDAFNYADINRTLRKVPGVYIQEEDGFGLRPNIGMRGSGSNRSATITVMEDGVLAAPAPYAAPSAYYFPTIGRMHAVEVLKGSSQIKYGPFTAGGALNLLSTPIPTAFSGQFSALRGSYGIQQLQATVGNAHKHVAYVVETFNHSADGFKVLDNGGPTGFDKSDFLAKVKLQTGPKAKYHQSLLLKMGWMSEQSNETYLGLSRSDFDQTPFRRYYASQHDIMESDHRQLSATYAIQLHQRLSANVVAYRNDFTRNWYKLDKVQENEQAAPVGLAAILDDPITYANAYDLLVNPNGNGYDRAIWLKANQRVYISQGVQASINGSLSTGAFDHELMASVRVHTDEMDRFQHFDYYNLQSGQLMMTQHDMPGTESNRIEAASAVAAYLQYTMTWRNLTIVPGIRQEYITLTRTDYGQQDPSRTGENLAVQNNTVQVWLPGIGFHYALNDNTQLFGGVHRGFTPPGTTPGTNPEKSINYELGTRLHKAGWQTEAVLFYNDYSNLLGADNAAAGGAGTTDLFNGGAARIVGLEWQANYNVFTSQSAGISLPVFASYTYTHATFRESFESDFGPWGDVLIGDFLPYLPQHQLAFGASLQHHRYAMHVNGRYNSAMRLEAGQDAITKKAATDANVTVDISTSVQVHQKIALSVQVINATNAVYIAAQRPAGVRPGTPRIVMAGIQANF